MTKRSKPAPARDARVGRLKDVMHRLNAIASALSQEHDLDHMLEMILTYARELTGSDAGSLYLVQKDPEKEPSKENFLADKKLYFKLAQNDSVIVPFKAAVLDITQKSAAGFVALTGKPLSIADVYRIPRSAPYGLHRSFDKSTGYRTASMLLVPMHNHRGELLGVIQLINRRKNPSKPLGRKHALGSILPFDQDSEDVVVALAGQATVAVENFRLRQAMRKLHRIGISLTQEHDLDRLLGTILTYARELTDSDAGSLYLVQPKEGREPSKDDYLADKVLFFKLTQNDSLHVPFRETELEITPGSIAGYVALSAKPLNIRDVGEIPDSAPYTIDRTFDETTGYKTLSMLTVPMLNQRSELLGVLQLINRRRSPDCRLGTDYSRRHVLEYDLDSEAQAMSLAGQAAVAIENSRLYAEIKQLFDSFVHASVTAIEARDPTTSGHSSRVALYTVSLADMVTRVERGPYSETAFSPEHVRQLKYASLLHDFGKIGVREAILVKANKLYPHELALIERRGEVIKLHIQLQAAQRKLEAISASNAEHKALVEIEHTLSRALEMVERDIAEIRKANRPSVLEEDSASQIHEIAKRTHEIPGSDILTLITEDEAKRLGIRRGSLSEEERHEIETHVSQTYKYLKGIPWPRDLARVPEIAYTHHEKLNGKGYPRALKARDISVEARIMAICDIYDALTAWDRPYKKAMPVERALSILEFEAKNGALDNELVSLFVTEKIYERARPPST